MKVGTVMIVIGAGITGCVIARYFADNDYKVHIYEKREHIGGAIYDYMDETGSYIHKFGPHIFHTNSDTAYLFINRFSHWNLFNHKVLGQIQNVLCPIPFNFTSIETLFPEDTANRFIQKLSNFIGQGNSTTIGELSKANDNDLKELADFIYRHVFLNYTTKQWGVPPEELGGTVMSRVPVRASYDDYYFSDQYQLIPRNGYTSFLKEIINHENIELHTNCDMDKRICINDDMLFVDGQLYNDVMVYTGCLDRLLNYQYGILPYRTLKFVFETTKWKFQPVAVVNYPNAPEFTRITEFGHFYPDKQFTKTTLMYEYPLGYDPSSDYEPYYPIPTDENDRLYQMYCQRVNKVKNFFPAGRLGSYKYINMDAAILEGLSVAQKIIKGNENV